MYEPAYDRSWNLPAIHWIEIFSKNSSAALKNSAKSSFPRVSMVLIEPESSVDCLALMRGWYDTQTESDHPKNAT